MWYTFLVSSCLLAITLRTILAIPAIKTPILQLILLVMLVFPPPKPITTKPITAKKIATLDKVIDIVLATFLLEIK